MKSIGRRRSGPRTYGFRYDKKVILGILLFILVVGCIIVLILVFVKHAKHG